MESNEIKASATSKLIAGNYAKTTTVYLAYNGRLRKESEKAICWVGYTERLNGDCGHRDFWMPKSIIKIEDDKLIVPSWFFNKLLTETGFTNIY